MEQRERALENLVDPSFWRGKKVLLTGHTGFKGSWLAIWLHQMGSQVHGISLPPEPKTLFNQAGLEKICHNHYLDICDWAAYAKAVENIQPELVLHMAAQSLVGLSYELPVQTYATNVMGTVHTLELARLISSVRAILIVTTDKCYRDNKQGIPHVESDPLGGHDPYSNSKACAELVTQSYADSFFAKGDRLFCATARAGNVIGGGDWSRNRLIPDIVRAWMAKSDLNLRNPLGVRPWQHVLEPLSGYLLLLQSLSKSNREACGAWNFSPLPSSHQPAGWIVDQMKARLPGADFKVVTPPTGTYHETEVLRLDSHKAQGSLGWRPRWNIAETLDRVSEWYRAFQEEKNLLDVCQLQIEKYSRGQVAEHFEGTSDSTQRTWQNI